MLHHQAVASSTNDKNAMPDEAHIANELARLRDELYKLAFALGEKASPPPSNEKAPHADGTSLNPNVCKQIRTIMRARQRRTDFLPEHLFADPAWDMLLELYHCELSQQRVSVTSLCAAAQVPATTALRWIGNLEDEHLVYRRADPFDGRRIYVALTDTGISSMMRYFETVSPPVGA